MTQDKKNENDSPRVFKPSTASVHAVELLGDDFDYQSVPPEWLEGLDEVLEQTDGEEKAPGV